ncbi:hypothetical protein [Tuwongella immobilis]|uniref:Uncharacterized protein n=1 Tax=Tuwongella immobilis TaxID=692036 RepID=A0A6C2YVX1_9BACT|nr:hypothetical protein [Tuwongella immobilis]VIP05594.1 Uncharacterized protein OS=Paenibacillus mucilaginosus (strain KNP414) GN=KNP414_06548 PE=4 SV=1 [Tuwongella immobilis]VTS08543.1 Uncharacterized protein OS=Paenibacillus mucilaginosus (strain KNP414) GN=KNP414_06548 PE=4 SV=1 [Tuwongella immobilis]
MSDAIEISLTSYDEYRGGQRQRRKFHLPDPELEAAVNAWLDADNPDAVSVLDPGWPGVSAVHLCPPRPHVPKSIPLNCLYWPVGASRCGLFRGLMAPQSLPAVSNTTGIATWFLEFRQTRDGRVVKELVVEMHLVSEIPLSRIAPGFVLLTFVDYRFFSRGRLYDPADAIIGLPSSFQSGIPTPVNPANIQSDDFSTTGLLGISAGVALDSLAATNAGFRSYPYVLNNRENTGSILSGDPYHRFVTWAAANEAADATFPQFFSGGKDRVPLGRIRGRDVTTPLIARTNFGQIVRENETGEILPEVYYWMTPQWNRPEGFIYPIGHQVYTRMNNQNGNITFDVLTSPITTPPTVDFWSLMPAIHRDRVVFDLRDDETDWALFAGIGSAAEIEADWRRPRFYRERVTTTPDNIAALQKIALAMHRNWYESAAVSYHGIINGFAVISPDLGHDITYHFKRDHVAVHIFKNVLQHRHRVNLERGDQTLFLPANMNTLVPNQSINSPRVLTSADRFGINTTERQFYTAALPNLGLFAGVYSIPGKCITPGTVERYHFSGDTWGHIIRDLTDATNTGLIGKIRPEMLAPDADWSRIANNPVFMYPQGGIDGGMIRPGTIPWQLAPSGVIPASKISGLNQAIRALLQLDKISNSLLQDNAVSPNKIVAGSITSAKLANNSVTAVKIADGTITLDKFHPSIRADLPIRAIEVMAGSVATSALVDEAVTAAKLAAESVTTPKIAPGAITADKLAPGVLSTPGANSVGTSQLQDDSVTANKLAAESVTTTKIAPGAVTNAQMAPLSVGTGQYQGNSVTDFALAANAVTTPKLADGAVNAAKIAAGAAFKVGDILRGETF